MKNARITWDDNNADELGHRIYRSLSPMDTADMPPAHAELGPDVTEWTDTDTPQDVDVYYRVSAYTATEEAFSDEVLVNTLQEGLPTTIGEEFGGGYYIGNIEIPDGDDAGEYAIIMAGPEGQAPTTLQWKTGYTSTTGTDSTRNGLANTLAMEAAGLAVHPAASYCRGYAGDGHDDWYLPAKDELALAWMNRAVLAGLAMDDEWYWSSSQQSTDYAWHQDFSDGTQIRYFKPTSHRVRPVRRLKI